MAIADLTDDELQRGLEASGFRVPARRALPGAGIHRSRRTRSRTAACSRIVDALHARSSRPSSGSVRTASPSTSSGWRTTRFAEKFGEGRYPYRQVGEKAGRLSNREAIDDGAGAGALDHLPESRGLAQALTSNSTFVGRPWRLMLNASGIRSARPSGWPSGSANSANWPACYRRKRTPLGIWELTLLAGQRAVLAADSLDDSCFTTTRVVLVAIHHNRAEFRLPSTSSPSVVSFARTPRLAGLASPAVEARVIWHGRCVRRGLRRGERSFGGCSPRRGDAGPSDESEICLGQSGLGWPPWRVPREDYFLARTEHQAVRRQGGRNGLPLGRCRAGAGLCPGRTHRRWPGAPGAGSSRIQSDADNDRALDLVLLADDVTSGTMRAAIAAAEPPLDPPGVRSRFHGLRETPNSRLRVNAV